MKQLWAPWRMDYITGPKQPDCVFCIPGEADEKHDAEKLVLYRGELVFVILNRYPYASGHLMVIPYRHVPDLADLTAAEATEMMLTAQTACGILRKSTGAEGLNIGINLGQAAGAGIREHVHMHVVPRWIGDSQFIAVFDDTRLIPEYLQATYQRLRPLFHS